MRRRPVFICLLLCSLIASAADSPSEKRDGAFVALLYGEDFLLGVRVLGQSIKESNTHYDRVVIVTGRLSSKSETTLKNDGWVVMHVDTIANPGQGPQPRNGYPRQFSAVYTKLTIFNLAQYNKVVYLDADTILLRNADELFTCPGFCATLRHSERLNSGVMTVTPSEDLYKDMLSKIETTKSYTGGDQGFINAYFEGFVNAPLFDPEKIPKDAKMMRLGTEYNADIGLYILNSNRWMIPESDIKIVHYTLGPFKPWNWWTSWIVADLKAWQRFRYNLGEDAYGNFHGMTTGQRFSIDVLPWVPLVLAAIFYYRYVAAGNASSPRNGKGEAQPSTSSAPMSHSLLSRTGLPKRFTGNSILIGFLTLLIPVWISFATISRTIFTFWGWFLMYEWVIFLHVFLFGLYLKYCYDTGKKTGASNLPTFKFASWSCPRRVTMKSLGIGVVLILVTPWMSSMLFVGSLLGKVIVTVACALVLVAYLTHVYSTLPVRWFAYGRNESNSRISVC